VEQCIAFRSHRAKSTIYHLYPNSANSISQSGKKKKKALREALKIESESGVQDFADQGFCRPRVLILCPFRGTALKVVESIKRILGDNTSMSNKDKFEEEFGPPDDDSEDGSEDEKDSETAAGKSKRKSKNRKVGTDRPEDWKALFEGNAP
jgi:U3 small nucleolar RNA-associated protein 25